MSVDSEKAKVAVAGILGTRSDEERLPCMDLVAAMVSNEVLNLCLSDTGLSQLARIMIEEGFGIPENLIREFSHLSDYRYEGSGAFSPKQQAAIDIFLKEAISVMTCNLKEGTEDGPETIGAAVLARIMSDKNEGQVIQFLRLCGQSMGMEVINQYGEKHPYVDDRWTCMNDKVREWLIEGLFRKLGFWRIWILVRPLFIGKKPEKAEAEMERQKRIAVLRAKLEGAWIHPVDMNDPGIEKIIREEKTIYVELMDLDPDFMDWFNRKAPNNRRED